MSQENLSSGFQTSSYTNPAVQPQKMARGSWLEFQIKEVEELHYLCSESEGADQLCGCSTADLCLCFRIYAKSKYSRDAAYLILSYNMCLYLRPIT